MLRKIEIDLFAALDAARVDLGNVGVDAQGLKRLHVEQFVGAALGDQLADVDGARGDHAVKGGVDLFKRLQFLEPLHVGLGGANGGGGRGSLVGEGIGILFGNRVGLDQVLVALGLDVGVVGGGLGGGQVGNAPGRAAGRVRGWRFPPGVRPFSRGRQCRSTTWSGSPKCGRRWGRRCRRLRCRAAQRCQSARRTWAVCTITVGAAVSLVVSASTLSL